MTELKKCDNCEEVLADKWYYRETKCRVYTENDNGTISSDPDCVKDVKTLCPTCKDW